MKFDIDFTTSMITWRGEKFPFPAARQRAAVVGDRRRAWRIW